MSTEKNIISKGSDYDMVKDDIHKPYDPSRRESEGSVDYRAFLERSKTGNPSFDAFVEALYGEMQIYDEIDPYKRDPLKPITDKADDFLRRHAGISYISFLRQAKPEGFTENDFGKLPEEKNLRRRLFNHRAMLYLAALEDSEKMGHDIDKVLQEVKEGKIPYIKRESDEPTFREILRVLGK